MTKKIFSALLGAALCATILSVFSVDSKAAGLGQVSVNSASIAGENVVVKASAAELPDSDDGKFYLFAEKVYQTGPAGSPVASVAMGPSATFSFPLEYKTTSCHLYDKFQAQNNVADVAVTIRRFNLHNSGSPGDELDSHTVAIV